MPSGNGAKAQQKRERNQEKAQKQASAHSQLKVNQQAMSIKCKLCMQPFMGVTNSKSLKEHSDAKHPKNTFKDCFPDSPEP